jgi:hypothetical protein
MVNIINSLETAADAYIATAADDPTKPELFMAVEEWMTASYEADGYSDEDIKGMDIASAAADYIERRRGA